MERCQYVKYNFKYVKWKYKYNKWEHNHIRWSVTVTGGDVIADGISLKNHKHGGGVQSGGSLTSSTMKFRRLNSNGDWHFGRGVSNTLIQMKRFYLIVKTDC